MPVNVQILAGGVISAASVFLIGRYFATMTEEKAAEIRKHNSGLESLTTIHRFGKFVMLSAPVVLGLMSYVALTADGQ